MAGDPFTFVDDTGTEDKVKIPTEKKDATAWHILKPVEEKKYLAAATEHSQDLADLATIMLYQGCRPGEILALQKNNVDIEKKRFTIWFSNNEGKTVNAHRTLSMTAQTLPIFIRRMNLPSVWLFPSSRKDGHVVTIQKAHEWVEAQTKINCRPYDLRHTFATRFAMRGGTLPTLAKILGHADLSLLMRYVHPSQADMDSAMAAFSEGFPDAAGLERLLLEYSEIEGGPIANQQGGPKGGQKN